MWVVYYVAVCVPCWCRGCMSGPICNICSICAVWAVWKAAALNCLPQPARVRAPPLRWWMSLRGPQPQSIWETHDGLGVFISARTPEANSGCTPTSPVRFSCEGPPSTLDESLHFYFLHCYLPLSRFPAFPQSRSPDFCPA